ncbi:hypothetical protein TYRP_012067 [Tyrophagus putrescentiae]|nr:hypothetical protein TYRP_012067 [Tyrophagus putrescentiae]
MKQGRSRPMLYLAISVIICEVVAAKRKGASCMYHCQPRQYQKTEERLYSESSSFSRLYEKMTMSTSFSII